MGENFNIVGGLFRDIHTIFSKYYSNNEEVCLKFVEDYYSDILKQIAGELNDFNILKRKVNREVKDSFTNAEWICVIHFLISELNYYKEVLSVVSICINNYKENGDFGDLELITGMLGSLMELNDQTTSNYNNIRSWISEKGYDIRGLKIGYNLYNELRENIGECSKRLLGSDMEWLYNKNKSR